MLKILVLMALVSLVGCVNRKQVEGAYFDGFNAAKAQDKQTIEDLKTQLYVSENQECIPSWLK